MTPHPPDRTKKKTSRWKHRVPKELIDRLVKAGFPASLVRRMRKQAALTLLGNHLKGSAGLPSKESTVLISSLGDSTMRAKPKRRRMKRKVLRTATEVEAKRIKREATGPYDNARKR